MLASAVVLRRAAAAAPNVVNGEHDNIA
jgi:hypothetical protein